MSGALLLAAAACGDDAGITEAGAPAPAAIVRFVNTGTDWGTVDLRFVDRVENLPTFQGVGFRGSSGVYQRVEAGQRHARVFPFSTNLDTTSIRLWDAPVTLATDTRYTLVYAGRADAAAPEAQRHRLVVIEDPATLPIPAGNSVAIKVLHTAVGTGNVDVYVVAVDSVAATLPADWQTAPAGRVTVNYLQQSAYVSVPALNVPRAAGTAAQRYRLVVTAAGETTPLFQATPDLPGAPAPGPGAVGHGTVGPQPGVQIPGSVFTAVVAPGATPGTRGATAATEAPTAFLLIDKPLNVAPAQ